MEKSKNLSEGVIFPKGEKIPKEFSKYFTGNVWLNMSENGKSRFKSYIPLIMDEREKLLEGVSSDEEKIVKSVLKRIEENVRKYSL